MEKWLYKIMKRRENDTEFSQSLVRIMLSSLVCIAFLNLFLIKQTYPHAVFYVCFFHLIYSFVMFYFIYKNIWDSKSRIRLNLFIDLLSINLLIYFCDVSSVFLYPLMLWVIVGNGMRFGLKELYLGSFFAIIFFLSATFSNKHWENYEELLYSLTIGLLALPFFYHKLIKGLHQQNAFLNQQIEERTKEIEYRFYHDFLTGLKNRISFDKSVRNEDFYVLMLIDINGFNRYDHLYGFEVATRIIQEFSIFLKDFFLPKNYEVFRVYEDVFAVLKKEKTDLKKDLDMFFKELLDFRIHIEEISQDIQIDVTIGASIEKEFAIQKADMALKYAKEHQISFALYDKKMDTKEKNEKVFYWIKEIKEAIQNDNIIPVFQPIVDRYGKIQKFECLIRLKKEDELISPALFLDIAQKTNLYKKLTIIMIRKSFMIMSRLNKSFTLNLSFNDITDKEVLQELKNNIQKYKIGKKLILEIIESENVEDYKYIKDFIKEFKSYGVRIAIDDFGSGFSNYLHILEIMPDILKIDGSLIKNIDKDQKSYILVNSIVDFAKKLNIKIVAEFVRNEEVFLTTKKLGIDEFQGFYFYPPLKEEELEKILAEEDETKLTNKAA